MSTHLGTARGLVVVCLLSLSFAACDSADPDPDPNPGDIAPTVITPEAFDLTDALFPDNLVGSESARGGGDNFANAALRVAGVTTVVGIHLIVPRLATAAALNADPFVEDGTWFWTNTVRINEADVTFELAGTPEGTDVDWAMRITSSDPVGGEVYDDFVLYTAETAFDGDDGSWQLYYRIDGERTRVLDADFEAASEAVKTLTFSVPDGDLDAAGDAVVYGVDGDGRLFEWDQSSAGNAHLIEWDAETQIGSITATNYNGGERACWDENLQDVSCE